MSNATQPSDDHPPDEDWIMKFKKKERLAKKHCFFCFLTFLVYLASAIVGSEIVSYFEYSVSQLEELFFSLFFWVGMVIFIAMAERAYRCPRCNNRPFSVIGKGLTYAYDVQQSLSKDFSVGRCRHCGAQLKEPRPFIPQRRKW